MDVPTRTFYYTPFSNPKFWLPMVLLVVLAIGILMQATVPGWWLPSLPLLYLLSGIAGLLLLNALTERVRFSPEGIRYSSLLHREFLAWKEVKDMGAFRTERTGPQPITWHSVQSTSTRTMIYFSTETPDWARMQVIRTGYISVHFRESLRPWVEAVKRQLDVSAAPEER